MTKVRRTPHALFYLEDEYTLDMASLLRAERPPTAPEAGINALVILTGQRHRLRRSEFAVLLTVPAEEWIAPGDLDGGIIAMLTDKGLLLSDADNPRLSALRQRDEALTANAWNLYAALYHYMTQWSGVDTSEGVDDATWIAERDLNAARAFIDEYGEPPGAFADGRATTVVPLPGADREGTLYQTLLNRRTTRAFDPSAPMTLEQLDTVLRYVFGCHGHRRGAGGVMLIKRTSPSGGGLHPTEVYAIVTNVDGVAPGLYHYSVLDHALGLLRPLDAPSARALASSFMAGQTYFGDAQVSFILTARFYRNQWKYRRHHKAYAVMLMDAAHLSQTLYLVSSDLGLGAFVTVSINARDIEAELGLDGVGEGVVAMAGCGVRAAGESPLEPDFSDGVPA
jgi:putative peptide maturation dehydrogenase